MVLDAIESARCSRGTRIEGHCRRGVVLVHREDPFGREVDRLRKGTGPHPSELGDLTVTALGLDVARELEVKAKGKGVDLIPIGICQQMLSRIGE